MQHQQLTNGQIDILCDFKSCIRPSSVIVFDKITPIGHQRSIGVIGILSIRTFAKIFPVFTAPHSNTYSLWYYQQPPHLLLQCLFYDSGLDDTASDRLYASPKSRQGGLLPETAIGVIVVRYYKSLSFREICFLSPSCC